MLASLFWAGSMGAVSAHTLKLSTWNMDWLTLRPSGDPALPDDVPGGEHRDFSKLAAYARHLDADVVAFEEVDGPTPASRIFSPRTYQIILTPDPVVQRVGVAVRRDLHVTVNEELSALNVAGPDAPHQLRGGLDVTVSDGIANLRLLVVHLKTGCWDQPLNQRQHSCPTLYQQVRIMRDWMLERQDEGEAYAVLGDFNRRLTPHDPLMQQIEAEAPVTLTTAGRASPCWGGEYFIDHILLGNAARDWLVPDSLRVMTYKNDTVPAGLSDHCPVSVRFEMP
ncbi:endonuclease/exonuclease/phosphatase family protein [Gluconobacter sp. Dm-62]|uniref:endonuclease/exonuclease/phosphatase family protein n=1 Tax=Gluconobacter sp. Dm-62 TaxID=2799804 RepID=UPI001B8D2E69|nr:endonuclease/exonuclease/phosphatase family protein [Gluconobacter sp. Dm-62]MBS1102660.1 endonuclease/exonuclease/phosphatase family protein [Gluconobacter sp. Dm-62]